MNLTDLYSDGDIHDLGDGHFLRLRIEPDLDTTLDDYADCYGRIGWGMKNPATGREYRPEGFDGNAERLSIMHDVIWWQPPADVPRDSETFNQIRDLVRDIASFGFSRIVLEYGHGADAYGRLIVRDYASMGGVEPLVDREHVASILGDLVADLTIDPQSPMNTYESV